uniref:LITAF domain-containing protein n=1 Tax=Stegastes partitus TaxID=144197 RepID=A0A3B5B4L7_9TELE
MESFSSMDEPFPTPPPYFLPGKNAHSTKKRESLIVWCGGSPTKHSFESPHVFSLASAAPSNAQEPKFVTFETGLYRSPALTTCISCQAQVTTQVTFRVGTHTNVSFLSSRLLLGCCLIPFFVNHFKDAYHTCPRCERVLHVERKTCCQ